MPDIPDIATEHPGPQARREMHTNITPLQDLMPPEIRNMVYNFALVEPTPIDISAKSPGLLVTCKHIRAEALEMYFHRNTFAYTIRDDSDDDAALRPLMKWLTRIGPVNCSYLRRIHVTLSPKTGSLIQDPKAESNPWTTLVAHMRSSGCIKHMNIIRVLVPQTYTFNPAFHALVLDLLDPSDPGIDKQEVYAREYLRFCMNLYIPTLMHQAYRSRALKRWTPEEQVGGKGLVELLREAVWIRDRGRSWDGKTWPPWDVDFEFEEVWRAMRRFLGWKPGQMSADGKGKGWWVGEGLRLR